MCSCAFIDLANIAFKIKQSQQILLTRLGEMRHAFINFFKQKFQQKFLMLITYYD